MTVSVIAQARMGSSRLPGKVLMPLGGQPVLHHVLRRLLAIRGADLVCIATSDLPRDDAIAASAGDLDVPVVRGSESDVLDRFCQAAQQFAATTVMRVTCDCPLIDPALCDELLRLFLAGGCDYAAISTDSGWPQGLDCEVFSAEQLFAAKDATLDPYDREHVTPWIIRHAQNPRALLAPRTSGQRWVLDTQQDYVFLKAVYEQLGPDQTDWQSVTRLIAKSPKILELQHPA